MAFSRTLMSIYISLSLLGSTTFGGRAGRGRRSDDIDPLQAVVSGLSQRLDQVSAQLQAQERERATADSKLQAQIADLQNKLAVAEQPVAFTAALAPSDITGLGVGQTLKFNSIFYNVGSGYNPTTGFFTAPSAGTYAFYVHVMQNILQVNQPIQLFIHKNDARLVVADACCDQHHSGANMVTVHLDQGETTHVEVYSGSMLWGDHTTFTGFKLAP